MRHSSGLDLLPSSSPYPHFHICYTPLLVLDDADAHQVIEAVGNQNHSSEIKTRKILDYLLLILVFILGVQFIRVIM